MRQMRFRFILGIRNHAVLVVPFQDGGWGAVEIKRIHSIASHEEGNLYFAHRSSLSLLLQQLGCGNDKNFNICVLTGKWCNRNDGDVQLCSNSSNFQRYQMMDESIDTPVVAPAGEVNDPFIIVGSEASDVAFNDCVQRMSPTGPVEKPKYCLDCNPRRPIKNMDDHIQSDTHKANVAKGKHGKSSEIL